MTWWVRSVTGVYRTTNNIWYYNIWCADLLIRIRNLLIKKVGTKDKNNRKLHILRVVFILFLLSYTTFPTRKKNNNSYIPPNLCWTPTDANHYKMEPTRADTVRLRYFSGVSSQRKRRIVRNIGELEIPVSKWHLKGKSKGLKRFEFEITEFELTESNSIMLTCAMLHLNYYVGTAPTPNFRLPVYLILKCLFTTSSDVFSWFMIYFKHEIPCLTTSPNTEKRVENTTRCGVFCEIWGVRKCIQHFLGICSQSGLKLERK